MKTAYPVYVVAGNDSTAIALFLRIAEEKGYSAVNGLPVTLLPDLLLLAQQNSKKAGMVFGIGSRSEDAKDFPSVFDRLAMENVCPFVLYFTADTGERGNAGVGQSPEENWLGELRGKADCVFDTRDCSESLLRSRLFNFLAQDENSPRIVITSVCVRCGMPDDATLFLDLSFLPDNSGVSPDGGDKALVDALFSDESARVNRRHILALCDDCVRAGKPQCHIVFGSEGGQFRSVGFALYVADYYSRRGFDVSLTHRDRLSLEGPGKNQQDQQNQGNQGNKRDRTAPYPEDAFEDTLHGDPVSEETACPGSDDPLFTEAPKAESDNLLNEEPVSSDTTDAGSNTQTAGAEEGLHTAVIAVKPFKEHLQEEFSRIVSSDTLLAIGRTIIEHLTEDGFQLLDMSVLAEMTQSSLDDVEEALSLVKNCAPKGLATRDDGESLLAQVESFGYGRNSPFYTFAERHIDDIRKGNYIALKESAMATCREILPNIGLFCELFPKPCFQYWASKADVTVRRANGGFSVCVNAKGRHFMPDVFQDATWDRTAWISVLDPGISSIYLVMESLVRRQTAFFEEGLSRLLPLTLSDIAADTGRDESTVSRVTAKRTVATPFGLFPMSIFFGSALEAADGSFVSSQSVKALIKEILAEEDPKSPLSDDELASEVNNRYHLAIARRTVAKYRTQLGIASSSKRRLR